MLISHSVDGDTLQSAGHRQECPENHAISWEERATVNVERLIGGNCRVDRPWALLALAVLLCCGWGWVPGTEGTEPFL